MRPAGFKGWSDAEPPFVNRFAKREEFGNATKLWLLPVEIQEK